MMTLRNLLVAVPASDTYQSTLQYAIGLAQDLQLKLTIALVYTSNLELQGEEPQDEVALARQKKYVQTCFTQLREDQLPDTPSYRLVSIDGPLCDAIQSAVPVYHPDLIISAADPHLPLEQLVQSISFPLLLVPLGVQYHCFRHLGLAYDATSLPRYEPIRYIRQLAQTCGADVEVVEVDRKKVSQYSKRANVELDYLFKDVVHRFYYAYGELDPVESIEHHVQQHPIDVLVMLARRQLSYQDEPGERHTITMIKRSSIPILLLKK